MPTLTTIAKQALSMPNGKTLSISVKLDREIDEYVVRILGMPEADYFTSDREDALGTMLEIVRNWTEANSRD